LRLRRYVSVEGWWLHLRPRGFARRPVGVTSAVEVAPVGIATEGLSVSVAINAGHALRPHWHLFFWRGRAVLLTCGCRVVGAWWVPWMHVVYVEAQRVHVRRLGWGVCVQVKRVMECLRVYAACTKGIDRVRISTLTLEVFETA
jgi:hypothetical protein